jgi:hypothetical protein
VQKGIAGRFLHEALALRDLCVALDGNLAERLLAPRLAQDWAPLPADFAAALRRRCLERAGSQLMAELLAAAVAAAPMELPDAVLAVCARFAQRPALVVATLAWLALEALGWGAGDAAPAGSPAPAPAGDAPAVTPLLAIARFIVALRERLPPIEEPLPPLLPPPGLRPADAAAFPALLAEAGFAERLAALLMQGIATRRRTREIAAHYPPGDLDGIALGPRAPANVAIEQIARLLELRLGQPAPGA